MQGMSKEAIQAYVNTNFHNPRSRSGFRELCGINCVLMASGAELMVGDLVYYYSSMLDAFDITQILSIDKDAGTMSYVEVDCDCIFDPTIYTTKIVGGHRWWSLDKDAVWTDTECYTLWRPISWKEAALVAKSGFRSAYVPFGPYSKAPEQRKLYPVYGNDPNLIEVDATETTTQTAALLPQPTAKAVSRWKRWFQFLT